MSVYIWYWEYSLIFPLSLITVLLCYYCCRVLCLRSIRVDDQLRNRQNRQVLQNQQAANMSQVYAISDVVVRPSHFPPAYKQPDLVDDLPPSYDVAIIQASPKPEDSNHQPQNPAPPV